MILHNRSSFLPRPVAGMVLALFLTLLASMALPTPVMAQVDPIPEQVKKLQMGASTATVMDIIKDIGTHSSEELPTEKASRVVWNLPNSPYYKNIAFEFTDKDRLFLIRFTLNDAARQEYHNLKKAVFKDYDFSWDKPMKLKVKDRDIVAYGPEKGMVLYFFEFTDKKTHEKFFELFNRSIRSTDRAASAQKEKTESSEQGTQGDKKPESLQKPAAETTPPVPEQVQPAPESKPATKQEETAKPETAPKSEK